MKKGLFILVLAVVAMGYISCEKVADITLNKSELLLIHNETETLIATVYPDDASNKKVKWKSDNTAVATVNEDGMVTAINKGNAIITAISKNGKKTATCFVSVDYRNKWVGSYDCEEEDRWWYILGVDSNYHQIWEYKMAIYQTIVDVNVINDSALRFLNRRTEEIEEVHVSATGYFNNRDWLIQGSFRGNFVGDSLYIYNKPRQGQGFGSASEYQGRKINNK